MRKLIVCGVPVKIHPALPLMFALALWLDEKSYILMACVFLILHEMAHVIVARRMNLRVVELELMPLGGAARIEGLWLIGSSGITKVALVGPLLNLALAVVFAALGWLFPMDREFILNAVQINALLFSFNMLPALPLDGGRVLCGLIVNKMGPERAVRIGVYLGMALAAVLVTLAALLFFLSGKINLTLIVCAFYLIACGPNELNEARGASLLSMLDRECELGREGVLPIAWLAVSAESAAITAVRRMRPGKLYRFAVYRNMECIATVEEKTFRSAILRDPNRTFDEIINQSDGVSTKSALIFHLQ